MKRPAPKPTRAVARRAAPAPARPPARTPAATPPPRAPRRTPRQDRSRERLERILDAASRVFAETGYDAATMERIAQVAGTSIGSVYQFFPNKLSLFNAIASRYVERVRALFDSFMTPEARTLPWFELVDGAIDGFAAFHAREPGFRAILLNWRMSADMLLVNDDINREFARRAEQVLADQAPGLPSHRRALVATMLVEVVSAMLILCARRGEPFGASVVAETKTMLRRYLEPIVTEHAAGASRPTRASRSRPAPPSPPSRPARASRSRRR